MGDFVRLALQRGFEVDSCCCLDRSSILCCCNGVMSCHNVDVGSTLLSTFQLVLLRKTGGIRAVPSGPGWNAAICIDEIKQGFSTLRCRGVRTMIVDQSHLTAHMAQDVVSKTRSVNQAI
jgi:hypothetical protein